MVKIFEKLFYVFSMSKNWVKIRILKWKWSWKHETEVGNMLINLEYIDFIWWNRIYDINSNSVTREVRNLCVVYVSNFTFQCFQRHISIAIVENFEVMKTGLIVGKAIPWPADFEIYNFLKSISNFKLMFPSWFPAFVLSRKCGLSSFKLTWVRTLVKVKWRSVWIVSE